MSKKEKEEKYVIKANKDCAEVKGSLFDIVYTLSNLFEGLIKKGVFSSKEQLKKLIDLNFMSEDETNEYFEDMEKEIAKKFQKIKDILKKVDDKDE